MIRLAHYRSAYILQSDKGLHIPCACGSIAIDMTRPMKLDHYFPPCGPCAFCGHPDKRHRLWDAIIAARRDGKNTVADIASWMDLPADAVRAVLRSRPYQKRIHA